MTFTRLVLVVLVALIVSVPVGMPSQAYAIIIGSQPSSVDPGETNSTTQAGVFTTGLTQAVPPNPGWSPALPGSVWVSYIPVTPVGGQTGNPGSPGFFVVGNASPPPPTIPTVTFREAFTLAPALTNYTGNLLVMADDSTSVIVDGVVMMNEAAFTGNTYTTCSDHPIGCLNPQTLGTIALVLAPGPHVFEFGVAQRKDASFGLDFSANLNVPEPGTILLLGTGLIGLGVALRRKVSRKD